MLKKFKEKLEFYIMYFSLKERKKREYERFKESIKELEKLSITELKAEYIDAKAKYKCKKISFLVFGIIILIVLNNIFKLFFYLFENSLKFINLKGNDVEIGKVMIILLVIFSILLIVLTLICFVNSIRNLRFIYKNLLLIEFVRKEKENKWL